MHARQAALFKKGADGREAEQRSIVLSGREITYTLRRSQRRTLGLTVDRRGLTVSIPLRVSVREAEGFMRERADWILEKLSDLEARPPAAPTALTDGARVSVLGAPCIVRLREGTNHSAWVEGFYGRELHITARNATQAKLVFMRALQRYALTYFKGRMEEFAWRLHQFAPQVRIPALRLTSARTRWGSCSQRSGIRLNWRLIHLPPEQVDYVVAHELSHLLEMNHSARFWAVVDTLFPGYEAPKAALRDAHAFIPVL
ncbi:MAG: SprT family zinc-dependent metalloprotease [Rhodocyclaceae bacterium]